MEEAKIVTNSPDAGDVIAFSRNTSRDHGNSTAQDVKQQTNKPTELNEALDSLRKQEKDHFGLRCSAGQVMNSLSKETQKLLNEVMDDKSVYAGDICKVLKSFGYHVSAEVMRRHRRRRTGTGCACK